MSIFNSVHYSAIGFDTRKLKKAAKEVHRVLGLFQEKYPFQTVIGTGTSGLSMLMALHMLPQQKYALAYLRKEHENSHGSMIEMIGAAKLKSHEVNYVLLDDFTESGETLKKMYSRIQNKSVNTTVCKGAILYDPSWASYNGTDPKEGEFSFKGSYCPCWNVT